MIPLELFERAIDERTALVATSHVFFTSGAVQDLAALTRLAPRGARRPWTRDQGAGQDWWTWARRYFYRAGGLEAAAGWVGDRRLRYVRPDLIAALEPGVTDGSPMPNLFQFDSRAFERARDARGSTLGTPSVASVYAQLAGLEACRGRACARSRSRRWS